MVTADGTVWFSHAGLDTAILPPGETSWHFPTDICAGTVDFDQPGTSGQWFEWNGELWGATMAPVDRSSDSRDSVPALVRFSAE